MKIAILITTFLRDDLLYNAIKKIIQYSNDDCFILIGDQNPSPQKEIELADKRIIYCKLSYDCGLSFARNRIVEIAKTLECDYCLLMADSLQLCRPIEQLNQAIELFKTNFNLGIVGFLIQNRIPWTRNLELVPGQYFRLTKPIDLPTCDMVANFFLARTQCLLDNPWDETLKLCEHEDFYWRLKTNTNWKVMFSDIYTCDYIKDRPPEYNAMRMRLYCEFNQILRDKYKIKEWFKDEGLH